MSSAITPDLVGYIGKLETMHKVSVEEINNIVLPTVLFTYTNKLEIMELTDADTDLTKNHQDNGATPPLGT